MLKVLKNLKESFLLVVAIIILLCIQAAADLNLPDFTSKIVNTGIQQGGIEYAVPDVITTKNLENLMNFTENDEQIQSYYELMEKNEDNLEDYPELKNQDIYELKNISKSEKENLESLIAKPLAIVYQLENEETANSIKQGMLESVQEDNPQYQVIEQTDIIDLIKQMPDSQKEIILNKIDSMLSTMSDSIIE